MDDALLGTLGKLFMERRDVFAEQHSNGSYTPVKRPIKMGDLRAHVEGEHTYGHYLLNTDSRCRLFAFDIDLVKTPISWEGPDGVMEFTPRDAFHIADHWARPDLIVQMNALAEGLARRARRVLDLPVACAFSGAKGVHVYAFTGSEPAADVQAAGFAILKSFDCFEPVRGDAFWRHESGYQAFEIEVFPKQTTINEGGYGNLLRLPGGVNLKTGKRGHFIRFGETRSELTPMPFAEVAAGALPW